MKTIFLDNTGNIGIDAAGNIAVASEPYALAQDAASAIRIFQGECLYDISIGIDYFGRILGKIPNLEYVRSQMIARAMTVPGVVAAQVFFTSYTDRALSGQVQVTSNKNIVTSAGF